MARQPRFDIAGIPQHIVQRRNDRQPCFAEESDYLRYLQELGEAATRHACAVHAYVLMTNPVHLLVTPPAIGAVSRMMQAIGRRYVGGFNARYRRTGTLWEGRFKAALVGNARYVLTCYRYIELNPVRAGMVASPADYRWSSHIHNAVDGGNPRVCAHRAYLELGQCAQDRRQAYRALFNGALDDTEIADLRVHTQQQRGWTSEKFRKEIEALAHRAAGVRPRGRPRSAAAGNDQSSADDVPY